MKKKQYPQFVPLITILIVLFAATHTRAQSLALGVKLSTMGPGVELIGGFGDKFALRAGYSHMAFNYTEDYHHIEIESTIRFKVGAISLVGDYYLICGLHLSAGVFYNLSDESISGLSYRNYKIGNFVFTPDKIGELKIRLKPEKVNPYIGLGFGRAIGKDELVSFNFELGAIYHGKPSVELEATGMIHGTANTENEKQIEENISNLTIYPLLTVQLSIKIL
jgi:hypothetical protein